MPYTKKAKDAEGARAEAIGTELTFLAGLSHPAQDRPEITTDGNNVVLPQLNLKSTLSDYLFDDSVSNKGTRFMESLGRVIAFNWYVGQGDLNITNVSLQNIWNKTCYPYDFDCCFQNIQSEDSFAKQRMGDVSYETVDLDAQSTGHDVVHAALINLRNSAKVSGVDTADFDKLFSNPDNLSAITKGLNKQLMKLSKIPPEKVSAIVDRHTPEGPEREAYNQFLTAKTQQAKAMALAHVKQSLQEYMTRVEQTGFDHGFVVRSDAQSKNREINYQLAKKYLESIDSGSPLAFDHQAILTEREKIRIELGGTGENVVRSDELNKIFALAAHFNSNPTNNFSNGLKAMRQRGDQAPPAHVVAQVISELPSNQSEIPAQFLQVDPKEIVHLIETQTVEDKPLGYQVKPGTEVTKNLLADLDRLKDELGGAPNFRNGLPTLNDEDAHRTFMGQPMPAVKDWFRMTLQKNWVPSFFWTGIAKLFNVTNNTTAYENAHIRIQRFGILSANKDRVFDILDSKDPSRYFEFNTMTGLAWHPKENGEGIEKFYINMMEDFLTVYYEDAKARGDDALIEYFKAYDGVCFEDRAKKIELYMASHPTLEMEAQAKDKGEIAMDIDPSDIASYDDNTKINNVLYAECGELSARKKGQPCTPQDLWDHLEKKGVVGREFPDGNGGKIKITMDYLNSDEVRSDLIDVVMVLDDGPKIIKAVVIPKDAEDIADYDSNTDIQKVLFEEIKELTMVNGGEPPTPQELWDRLEEKGIAGRTFPVSKGSEEKAVLSVDYLNQESVRENLIDDLMILEEGPKIVAKAGNADKETPVAASSDLDEKPSLNVAS